MHKIAMALTEYLIKNDIVNQSKKDQYIYGFEVFGLKCLNYGTILLLSVIFNILEPTLFFMVCFLSLRGRTGGYHAESAILCYIGTIGIYVLSSKVIAPMIGENRIVIILMLVASVIVILLLAPLNNINLELSEEELLDCKKSTKTLLLLVVSCIGTAFFIGIQTVCIVFAVNGITLDAVLLLLQKSLEGRRKNGETFSKKKCASRNS